MMKKETMRKLLLELLKDSKRSDRELAKVLGVSQPTITRMRHKLVQEGVIRRFTIIPDFSKLGYEIMAVTCFKAKMKVELIERATKWAMERPNIIFAGRAEGMGKNGMMISLHRDFAEFASFIADLMIEWGGDIEDYGTLLTPLKGTIVKPLSLEYLAKLEDIEE